MWSHVIVTKLREEIPRATDRVLGLQL
jgi:hypothetical protein